MEWFTALPGRQQSGIVILLFVLFILCWMIGEWLWLQKPLWLQKALCWLAKAAATPTANKQVQGANEMIDAHGSTAIAALSTAGALGDVSPSPRGNSGRLVGYLRKCCSEWLRPGLLDAGFVVEGDTVWLETTWEGPNEQGPQTELVSLDGIRFDSGERRFLPTMPLEQLALQLEALPWDETAYWTNLFSEHGAKKAWQTSMGVPSKMWFADQELCDKPWISVACWDALEEWRRGLASVPPFLSIDLLQDPRRIHDRIVAFLAEGPSPHSRSWAIAQDSGFECFDVSALAEVPHDLASSRPIEQVSCLAVLLAKYGPAISGYAMRRGMSLDAICARRDPEECYDIEDEFGRDYLGSYLSFADFGRKHGPLDRCTNPELVVSYFRFGDYARDMVSAGICRVWCDEGRATFHFYSAG